MEPDPDELIPTRWTLIGRLKNWDDQESWKEFFDIYWKLIYGVARKSGLTPQEAQDVVQETLVSICQNIKDFQADPAFGSFKSWLLYLTRWRIIDQIRKRPKEALRDQHHAGQKTDRDTSETSTAERVPDPAGNEFDVIWENEWERNLISIALEQLEKQTNARHYQIFLLHVIKQCPAEQVAKVAGVDKDQVYLVKHRLLPLFQEAIRELEGKMI
jgi:RNA polymerase sigma-70 factor (ECF subfamily)